MRVAEPGLPRVWRPPLHRAVGGGPSVFMLQGQHGPREQEQDFYKLGGCISRAEFIEV